MGSFGRQLGWWTRPLSALLGVCLVGLWALPAAAQTVVNVIDGPSLVATITQVDSNASARYVINLQNNITLSSAASNTLAAFNTTSAVTVNGNGFTLDGGGASVVFLSFPATSQSTISRSPTQWRRVVRAVTAEAAGWGWAPPYSSRPAAM
jgi:hypothetical protein